MDVISLLVSSDSKLRPQRPATFHRLSATLLSFAVVVSAGWNIPRFVADSQYYLALAQGRASEVPSPFSQRVLHPLAGHVLHAAGLSFPSAFVLLALIALVVLFLSLVALLGQQVPPLALPLLLAVPFVVYAYREAYLPDLTFAAGLAGFLFLLKTRPRWWAPLLLLPLFAVRESTLLVTLVLMVVAWRHRQRAMTAMAVVVMALGSLVGTLAAKAGSPGLHHIAGPAYLIGKVPFNFTKNIAGIPIWTNDQVGVPGECLPNHVWQLPAKLELGSIRQVGICNFSPELPLTTLALWLTLFGVAPTLLAITVWRLRSGRSRPVWLQVSLWSGLIAFVLAPCLGATVRRLVEYGWPAMLLALPVLLFAGEVRARAVLELLIISFALAWTAFLLALVIHGTAWALAAVILAIPVHVLAASLLRTELANCRNAPVLST